MNRAPKKVGFQWPRQAILWHFLHPIQSIRTWLHRRVVDEMLKTPEGRRQLAQYMTTPERRCLPVCSKYERPKGASEVPEQ